jgi:hypothetical protein
MKSQLSIFATLSIAILMISMVGIAFASPSVPPLPAKAVWFDNAPFAFNTATTPVGTRFNVTVACNMTDFYPNMTLISYFSWQVYFDYPSSWLNVTNEGFTGPLGTTSAWFAGHSTVPIGPADTGTAAYAGESLKGTDMIVGSTTTLFWVEFNITKAPLKGQLFTGKLDMTTENGLGNIIFLDADGTTSYAVNTVDLTVSYAWSQPTTKPFMGIEGPSAWPLTYGPDSVIGNTFDVEVYVKMIDPNWFLNNVTFTLTWNNTVIDALGAPGANFTLAPDWTVITNDFTTPGTWNFVATYTGTAPPLANKVLVATLHFTILIQQISPPAPASAFDESYLTFSGVVFWDHSLLIAADTSEQGHVIVNAFVVLKLPWLQVNPAVTIVGPAPSIGSIVYVGVDVKNLTKAWNTVAVQFRLQYDINQLVLVSVTEGPFMTDPTWNLYGTWFYSLDNPAGDIIYPFSHVDVADLLFPNIHTGIYDQAVFPNAPQTPTPENTTVNPTIAIFGFKILNQNCFDGANITTALNILPFWPPVDDNFVDKDGFYIADQPGINGTIIIEAINEVDRQIDLVGGSVNDGYGILTGAWPFPYPAPNYYTGSPAYLAFPTPFGGQGPDHWMDIVFPQSQIFLDSYVTYNYWPVQSKDVGFEIEGPYTKLPNGTLVPAQTYQVWAKLTATTDSNGVATTSYRMPWPCLNPDSITGIWKITSTVTIADQVVSDTMIFYYQRVVYVTSVTTDSYSYVHDQCIKVTVNYQTHAVEYYPALFAIVVSDNLTVPFGMALYSTTVGGATFCTFKNSTFTVTICIPKWAYAGNGFVRVSVYDKDPTIGGEALAAEYTPYPIINIYPY